MSIIGEGKHINFVQRDFQPEWQKLERYEYCESMLNDRETGYRSFFRKVMKVLLGDF